MSVRRAGRVETQLQVKREERVPKRVVVSFLRPLCVPMP